MPRSAGWSGRTVNRAGARSCTTTISTSRPSGPDPPSTRERSMRPAEQILTPAALRDWPLPMPGGDKSSRGRVLVIGGARTTPGAAMLAGLAALRVGAGVLTLAVAESVAGPVAAAIPEAAVLWL